jgi:hypothetical protein
MSSQAGRPVDHVVRAGRKDAKPGRDVRPVVGPSDAVLSAKGPLTIPGPGEQSYRPQPERPQISGSPDGVIGAPLSPPPDGAREGLQLGVDSAGGFTVPRELDGTRPKKHRRP